MILLSNKKIGLNYEIIDKYECGIVLKGWETKNIFSAKANIENCFGVISRSLEVFLINFYVSPNPSLKETEKMTVRRKKLLLNKGEILKIIANIGKNKYTLIPSVVYTVKNNIKVELCICKHKKLWDKRKEIIKKENIRYTKKVFRYKNK